MKKIFVLFALIMSSICAQAADWQYVDTNIPNLDLFLDLESVKCLSAEKVLYAIKYRHEEKPEKVAFLKTNPDTGYLGIIEAGDYEAEKYKPEGVFATPDAFMKPVNPDSFLAFAQNYVLTLKADEIEALKIGNSYTDALRKELYKNWNAPCSAANKQAVVIVTVGDDGSLLGYKFAQKTGDETADRSIAAAIEKALPLSIKPPKTDKNKTELQFIFERGELSKMVK